MDHDRPTRAASRPSYLHHHPQIDHGMAASHPPYLFHLHHLHHGPRRYVALLHASHIIPIADCDVYLLNSRITGKLCSPTILSLFTSLNVQNQGYFVGTPLSPPPPRVSHPPSRFPHHPHSHTTSSLFYIAECDGSYSARTLLHT